MTQERVPQKRQNPKKQTSSPQISQQEAVGPSIPSEIPDINTMNQQDIIALQRLVGNRAVMQMLRERDSDAKDVQRLPDQLSGAMEKTFSTDLSGVRIHTDARANQIARNANTDATTIGQDIYFGQGMYNPGTEKGNGLIARELAHIEQARTRGSENEHPSSEASAADRQDANYVSSIVQDLGANPAQTLQPAQGEPTKAQRRVLQRDGTAMEGQYSHARTAGIVGSKVLQGVATSILGPLSLVWRWPLIQKNMGEALGEDIGTFTGKKDDKMRYGGGKLGDALRFMAVYSEILKELLIWCSTASLITAIIAAATQGALTPVFVGIAIVTAMIGGVLALMKLTMTGLNAYRYFKSKNDPSQQDKAGKTKRQYIKAQMANDGIEALSAVLTTVLAAFGAGGATTSIGSVAAKDMGFTEGAAKGVGAGINMGTQNIITNVGWNSSKESLKEVAKPGKEHGAFGGQSGKTSDGKVEQGGFFKDGLVIKDAYSKLFSGKKKKDSAPSTGGGSSPETQVISQIDTIAGRMPSLQGEQKKENKVVKDATSIISDNSSSALKVTSDVAQIKDNMIDSEKKGADAEEKLNQTVAPQSEAEAQKQEKEINEGLKVIGEQQIEHEGANNTGTETKISMKGGLFSRMGGWFARKTGSIKQGAKRLLRWIMKGIIKFAGKFDKTDVDPNSVPQAITEEQQFANDANQMEDENTTKFGEIASKALEAQKGIHQLAEQEQQ